MNLFPDTLKGFFLHLIIVFSLLTSGVIIFFYVYLPYITNGGETITVPNLYGMKLDNVEDFLTQRDLGYQINDSIYSDEHEPRAVMKQYPKAGSKVKPNRKVLLSINRLTAPTMPVPVNILNKSKRNAEAILKSKELKLGNIAYVPSRFF